MNYRQPHTHAELMYTALTKVKADPGFAGLSEEVRGILAELLKGIPKAPK